MLHFWQLCSPTLLLALAQCIDRGCLTICFSLVLIQIKAQEKAVIQEKLEKVLSGLQESTSMLSVGFPNYCRTVTNFQTAIFKAILNLSAPNAGKSKKSGPSSQPLAGTSDQFDLAAEEYHPSSSL